MDDITEKWFKTWFSNKADNDHLFPVDKKEWLKLAFKAGFNTCRMTLTDRQSTDERDE